MDQKTQEMSAFLDDMEQAILAKSKSRLMQLQQENARHTDWDFNGHPELSPRFSELANKANAIIYIK